MKIINNTLYSEETPLTFTDGTSIYNELKKEYKTHKKGFFIYAPSGSGKTFFIKNQKEKDWIDGDVLWNKTHAFPCDDWWNRPGIEIDTIERRADVITEQAKKLGFWILGASCVDIYPDAIVILPLKKHLEYIKYRETHNYDGGLTSESIEKIKNNRKHFKRFSKFGVPVFKSIEEAVNYLSALEKEEK